MHQIAVSLAALASLSIPGGALSGARPQQQEVAQAVYAKVAPSVVLIIVEDASGKVISQGSGFVIDSNLIVTNAHVVRGGAVFMQTGVVKVPCSISRIDERADLAVLLAAVPLTVPALRAAPANTPIGIRVYALGNPQGLERTISEGLYTGPRVFDGVKLLQISAPISPGSSGGPIVDSNGLVVGIAVSTLESGQNLNFAVPVDTLIGLLGQPVVAQPPALRPAAPPAPAARNAPAPPAVDAALQEFQRVLKQRLAIRVDKQTVPQWLELRKQERDLLSAAMRATRNDDDLRKVHVAATNGHNDIALDAARAARQRASTPMVWHYFGIASAALEFSGAAEEPQKTALLQEARDAVLQGLPMSANGNAWLLAGRIHDASREWPSARAAFDLALKVGIEPADRPAALRGMWRSSGGTNNVADADRWWGEFVNTGRAADLDYHERGHYVASLKRWKEAAAIFEVLARNPGQRTGATEYALWYSMAYAHWMGGDTRAAMAAVERTLAAARGIAEADHTAAMAHTIAASMLVDAGSLEAASMSARAAIASSPTLPAAYTQLARVYLAELKYAEAEAQARKAVDLSKGEDSEAPYILASALYGQRKWLAAAQSFEDSARRHPSNAYPALNAALSYEQAGRAVDAINWYEDALRRDPAMKERSQILAAIAKLRGGN